MKLLHTSDWHLGMTFRGGITYGDDQQFIIDKICDIAIAEKIDGILLAGDIFDKSIASQDAIKLYDNAMTKICVRLGIPVYMIAGNHDGAERLSQCSALLEKSGLYIAGALEKEPRVINCGDVDIYLLPWISTDKVKTLFKDDAEQVTSMEDAYKLVLDKYRETFRKGHKNILVAHAFITNAETSESDRAAEVGRAAMVPAKVFEGFDYVALGHLHGPQIINEHIRYSGSIMQYSFGKEEKQQKGVVIIDTDTMEQRVIELLPLRKRLTIKGEYNEILNGDYDDDIMDAYLKIDVTDSFVGMDAVSALREKFKNLLEVTGKSLEKEDAKITMTIEELEMAADDPNVIFRKYCEDILEEIPDEHFLKLFENALFAYGEEVSRR